MKKTLAFGCLGLAALGLLAAAALLFLALTAEPLPTSAEALATIPEAEREALGRVCGLAGVEPASLRNIAGYDTSIFDHELNRRSFVVRDGRLVALCLRETPFSGLPNFGGLGALEALDLRGDGLTQWPDLSALAALRQADLSGQALPDPDPAKLPPNLERLRLAATKVADTAPLATLSRLRELDLSGTAVSSIEPILGLKLDSANLARTSIASLPDKVPSEGAWELDLDGAPVLNPPGYVREWPFEGWITTTKNDADKVAGSVGEEKVEVSGTAAPTEKPRAVNFPTCTDPKAPPVLLEVTCTGGKARIWLREPPGFFASPWMKRGKVKGFGPMRRSGYLSASLAPGETATLRGSLFLSTHDRLYEMPPGQRREALKPPDWCDYSFYLEPLDGATVTGLSFRATGP